jgi:ATP-dependent helicase/nuclease subunit B
VARELDRLGGRYRADQITIGIPDESLAPSLDRKLRQHGLSTRFVGGRTLGSSGPVQLLRAVAAYLSAGDFPSFAALVRHPDLFDWLSKCLESKQPATEAASSPLPSPLSADAPASSASQYTLDLLGQLDTYYNERLPSDFDLGQITISGNRIVASMTRLTKSLLEPLLARPAPVGRWLAPLRELLGKVYGQAELHCDNPADRPTRDAFNQLARSLEQLENVPAELVPVLSASETISLALEKLASVPVPPPRDPAAIEMLGWLELPQDDAPVLIVTSYNEGLVPSYIDADLFLPEPICRELGVEDNDRRYARDAYATSVLLHAREQVKFIVARRNVGGDPLTPSRLLFAADRETVARRALRIFSEENESLPASVPPCALPAQSRLPIPPAEAPAEPRERFSVSSFKSYLECPYRYYLRHVLRLVDLSDKAQELEANHFGSLLHDVLDELGRDESMRGVDSPEQIEAFLGDQLSQKAKQRFHSRNRGAIAVQLEQLRKRLEHFARWQAERVRGGWVIEHVEKSLEARWEVDGRPVILHGRVDRIDIHQASGEAMVFDYKSGDSASTPEQAHRRRKQDWIDLQLPLYRHLAAAAGIQGEARLGYIALPKDVTKIGHLPAQWSVAELSEADETARWIIRQVRANCFEPMSQDVKPTWDTFAAICQSRSLGRRPIADTQDEDS